jgi:hypothetical protein
MTSHLTPHHQQETATVNIASADVHIRAVNAVIIVCSAGNPAILRLYRRCDSWVSDVDERCGVTTRRYENLATSLSLVVYSL